MVAIIVSMVSGGLAGACASVFMNRWFHWQDLRRKVYPKVKNLFAAYMIRMEQTEGRFWIGVTGFLPAEEDKDFIDHRSSFLEEIIEFTELREVRSLRKAYGENMKKGERGDGQPFKLDLKPEYDALGACMKTLHEKLKI